MPRITIRLLPWSLALLALGIVLVGSRFALWVPVGAWLVVLGIAAVASRGRVASRSQPIGAAILVLPILFALAWEGGWWLIPADVAWLGLVVAERSSGMVAHRRA